MSASLNSTSEATFLAARKHFVLCLYAAIDRLFGSIERLGAFGGDSWENISARYPFLGKYRDESRGCLSELCAGLNVTGTWQDCLVHWERKQSEHLPLRSLVDALHLDFNQRMALMLIGLVEEDSRFGTLFAELQEPLAQRRPTLELIGQIFAADGSDADAWSLCRPLLSNGLVEAMDRQAPRCEWVLRIPMLLWDAMRGEPASRPAPGCRHYRAERFAKPADLVFSEHFLAKLERIPALIMDSKVQILLLRSDPGAEPLEVFGALARMIGRNVLAIEGLEPARSESLGAYCVMSRSMPVLVHELGPGESMTLPVFHGYTGAVGLGLGREGGLSDPAIESVIHLSVPYPIGHLRRQHWTRVLKKGSSVDPDLLAQRFQLCGGYIRKLGQTALTHAALQGREQIVIDDVTKASRNLNRQRMDGLAKRLETHGNWRDLIVADAVTSKLIELTQRCRHREQLLDALGPAFSNNANRGVRALFTGSSGTGKTLAAKILASELGMDLYRVDLAAVVNKYIGETEKNLHQVLTHAEALDVILLLDEGDSLLGARTEVKSANDRYANLETNFLLQRLEHYQGIVVITTNLAENIDKAFQRRMDVVVPFSAPQADERRLILSLHLPREHGVAPGYIERVAARCALNGGQLRNIALLATMLALDEKATLTQWHLERALRSEYRKMGGTFPLTEPSHEPLPQDGGMGAFLGALQGF